MDPVRFTVTLRREEKTGVSMILPIDVRAIFGRHRPPVKVRINDFLPPVSCRPRLAAGDDLLNVPYCARRR